jgi:nucleotide-binding universal stress UspA family protein
MTKANWERILAATDFSSSGNQAVDYAHALAERFGAELHVLHVARTASDAAVLFGTTGMFDTAAQENETSDWLGSILGETGSVRRVESTQIGTDVSDRIVHYAESHDIDVIVMATHGRNGMARFWLGSTTEEVIRLARCPVLVVRSAPEATAPPRAACVPSANEAPVPQI